MAKKKFEMKSVFFFCDEGEKNKTLFSELAIK